MRTMTRRDFLKTAAAGSVVVAGGGLLGACGSSSAPSASAVSSPRRGGVIRAGLTGGGASDTLDALNPITNVDIARVRNVFEPLVDYAVDAGPELLLAEEMTPNADATEWTIRLKSGVTWHNGKDLTVDDVMYTFRRIVDPKSPAAGAASLSLLDLAGMKKLDPLTMRVPCSAPFVTFKDTMPNTYFNIVPEGYDGKDPIGTGPFMVDKFTPGQQSTYKRNPNYWQSGLPHVDQVVMTDYADETSQVNALLGGQVDVVNLLSSSVLSTVTGSGKKLLISEGAGWTPITMRVDAAPFDDVRVRQAMRLLVDRKQMITLVFGGHGTLGNDIFGIWDAAYDKSIPQREPDIEKAKSLLKAAGREGMTFELVTADIAQGVVNAAQVFAKQAEAAGVGIKLRKVTVTEFYGANYLKWVFAQDYWYYNGYLPQVAQATLPNAPFNETHWNDSRYNQLYSQALSTVDDAKRHGVCHEMQMIEYNEGGYIIPYFPPVIDGYAPTVHGLVPGKAGIPLSHFRFKDMWLS
jgi:peptide/nickel transport system substrate-binding protein